MAKKGLISMKIEGFNEFQRNLKALGDDFNRELKKATIKAAEEILEDAMTNYKNNFTMRSGTGLDSFEYKVTEKNNEIYAVITAGGGDAYYIPFQELGSSKQEAKPFLRPAVDNKAQEVIDKIKYELLMAIKRAERRVR